MFVNRLQWQLGKEQSLSPRQYGFTPQTSTEDALYDAISLIIKGQGNRKLVAVISLDIEGAFDNAWWPTVITELEKRRVDPAVLRLISNYLENRMITLKYAGTQIKKPTKKGCVQGSTCGPILWNVQMDAILQRAEGMQVHVQAFADDVLVIAEANTANELEAKVNPGLEAIADWGRRMKMKFAAHKTQAILVTKKLKYDIPKLRMNNTNLEFGDSVKILGLTIDRSLNFLQHLDDVTRKSIALYKLVSRAARAQWGLNSDIVRSIYTAVIEPTILYASSAWAHIAQKEYARTRLDRVTRIFSISISKAHRTTSLVAAAALARVIPLDLRAKENLKIYQIKRGRPMVELPGRTLQKRVSPYQLGHPAERTKIKFGIIESEAQLVKIENNFPRFFTDGSKIEGKVGGALSCWIDNTEVKKQKFKLADYCSVYQAELYAVLGSLLVIQKGGKFQNANILSDSRSALEAICNPETLHPLVAEIRERLKAIKERSGRVELFWIKAHNNIPGNERADELAKEAALRSKTAPVYDLFPLSLAKYLARDRTIEEWEERYMNTPKGIVTKRFFPTPQAAYRTLSKINMNNLRAQLLTGHGGFRAYLVKFQLAHNPYCQCDGTTPETVEHILIECPRFARERFKFEMEVDYALDETTLGRAVNDDHDREQFLYFAEKAVRVAARANGSLV